MPAAVLRLTQGGQATVVLSVNNIEPMSTKKNINFTMKITIYSFWLHFISKIYSRYCKTM